jgi:hypothetical protein
MKCEICRTIERLGLEESAHELWYCADARPKKIVALNRVWEQRIQHFTLTISSWFSFPTVTRFRALLHERQHYVTLGL